ncbi:uncharacterized protein LOC106637033 [Copidosoma floridanum]|uniref:uncharacterized protein LOC106637033 n=1 Tax=Copidosoma floridanum TaxID=29053 RepID=UPI0006C969D3|nr:uncharacterized protein LOC106637033 [Copidosoma floridanum]XP_014205144.1 uncharacterized protein LOC106637033 [Copidosoma floridanum]
MKKRSLAGNVGIGIFLLALVCVVLAFSTSGWLVSDQRITNAQLEMLGLWRHCFRSLPNPIEADAPRRFFVGCRWIYDPFTAGYSDIRGFLLPPFMLATQFFFTICFLAYLITLALIVLYATCWNPEERRYVLLITTIGGVLTIGSICGCIAVIIFALFGNADGWMPGHFNNFFGWSFVVAIVGSVAGLIASLLFLVEMNIQKKKRKNLKESQTRFPIETRN